MWYYTEKELEICDNVDSYEMSSTVILLQMRQKLKWFAGRKALKFLEFS